MCSRQSPCDRVRNRDLSLNSMIRPVQLSRCRLRLFETPWTAARQASLSITNSRSLLKLISVELVMLSNHLISIAPFSSCLQSICSSIRVFSNESALHIRWPKYWSFSFNISPSNEHLRSCKFLSLIRFQSDAKTCGQADTVQPSS